MLFFNNINPDQPVEGRLVFASYGASLGPSGVLAYTARADLTPGTALRLGLKGSAKIYGPPRPLALWVLRRPLAWVRNLAGMSELALPALREDLSLMPGPLSEGAPTWTLYDPARHRFVRLGWQDFEILSRWALRTPASILAAMRQETTLRLEEADVMRLAGFLRQAGLLRASSARDTEALAAAQAAARRSAASWLMHNYLFLRIRLVNPDRFLTAMLPAVRWMFTRAFLAGLSAAALLGLFLISRQWDLYTHSLVAMVTPEGLLWMGAALSPPRSSTNSATALRPNAIGCRVTGMGIAFLVLWPVLWTDTTDAWRLSRRSQRLVIDAAGMLAEISVAVAGLARLGCPSRRARPQRGLRAVQLHLDLDAAHQSQPVDAVRRLLSSFGRSGHSELAGARLRVWTLGSKRGAVPTRSAAAGSGSPPPWRGPDRLCLRGLDLPVPAVHRHCRAGVPS